MNEQSSTNPTQSDPIDYRVSRRQRREDRRLARGERSRWGVWLTGLLLILAGAALLLNNTGLFSIPLTNWWALFILLPAMGAFERAWRMYRNAGNQWTGRANGALLAGLLLTAITVAFIVDLNWTIFGPFLVILVGLAILINAVVFR